jgi:DNA-binding GntR family transcriptional regulator
MVDLADDLIIEAPVPIRQKVYDFLRNEILSNHIAGGERLVEGRLARQINVSRTPIREALHILEMEGLVESFPRVGYRVKKLRWEDVEELCEIRAVNEILAAKWALKRITPQELASMKANIDMAEAEMQAGQPERFVERDAEFHEMLVKASGSERLLELCQMLRRHMLRYRVESLYVSENGLRAVRGHRRIMGCLEKKDHIGIEAAIREHLEQSKRDIHHYAFEVKTQLGRSGLKTSDQVQGQGAGRSRKRRIRDSM